MGAHKREYKCAVYIHNANNNAMDKAYWLFHILSFQGKNPPNPEIMSFFFTFFALREKKKSIASRFDLRATFA